MELSHVDGKGNARMVDVSGKAVSVREATAEGRVFMKPGTLAKIAEGSFPKGDVFAVARVAGIMAAKRVDELIPLCHSLPIESVTVDLAPAVDGKSVVITATARLAGKTGVEMEALTAVSVAALTVYDMCKAVDREMEIGSIVLTRKTGGRSGDFLRKPGTGSRADG
jgi:cyclic pyranopterin monophosphate synthase